MNQFILVFAISAALFACSHQPVKQKPDLKILTLTDEPIIGTTEAGQSVKLGGLSGLQVLGRTGSTFEMMALTDRGPNGSLIGKNRSFLLPHYSPRFVKLRWDVAAGTLKVLEQIPFRKVDGRPLTGLPPGYKDREMETPVDLHSRQLKSDRNGVDSESLCLDRDRTIWVGDEYGPDVLHFRSDGKLIERLKPMQGLPETLIKRSLNRGFEGVACINGHVYPILQSALKIAGEDPKKVPMLDYEISKKKVVATYYYPLENEKNIIGDLHAIDGGRFVAIEQNGKTGEKAFRHLYLFDPNKTGADQKIDLIDLHAAGYDVEKAEGLAVSGDDILLVSDNDFGLNGELDFKTGRIPLDGRKTVFAFILGILKAARH